MIKLIYEANPLNEMAIINPRMCKQLSIQVEIEQRDEGPVPHVHVYLDKTRNPKNCAFVRLDKPEYCSHHKDGKVLNKKQKEEFIKIMNSTCATFLPNIYGDPVKTTWYQNAVHIWAETYEDGDLDKFNVDDKGVIEQLDYSSL